jgi:hypothetical protein
MAETMMLVAFLLLMPQADAFLLGLWDTTTHPPLQRTVSPTEFPAILKEQSFEIVLRILRLRRMKNVQ